MTIEFAVPGRAYPAGSKRPVIAGNGRLRTVDASGENGKNWRHLVQSYAMEARKGPLMRGPLILEVRFTRARPQGHYGKKGLKASAPEYPIMRPDITKLLRAVEDSLLGVLIADDSQIVEQTAYKNYGDSDLTEIRITELAVTEQDQER